MLEEESGVAEWWNVLGEEHALKVGGRQIRSVPVGAPDVPRDIADRNILQQVNTATQFTDHIQYRSKH